MFLKAVIIIVAAVIFAYCANLAFQSQLDEAYAMWLSKLF